MCAEVGVSQKHTKTYKIKSKGLGHRGLEGHQESTYGFWLEEVFKQRSCMQFWNTELEVAVRFPKMIDQKRPTYMAEPRGKIRPRDLNLCVYAVFVHSND